MLNSLVQQGLTIVCPIGYTLKYQKARKANPRRRGDAKLRVFPRVLAGAETAGLPKGGTAFLLDLIVNSLNIGLI